MDNQVGSSFKLTKKLGSGAFGDIFLGVNTKTNSEVAIKLEKVTCPVPQLLYESDIYKRLNSEQNNYEKGIPMVYYTATERDYNFMVMDRLGPSLEDQFMFCKRKFTQKTIMLLALQMFDRIEYIHSKDIIHRDIKPDNYLMGYQLKSHKVFLIDFGLAKRVVKDNKHIPFRENKCLTGTARYASINTHLGIEQSRRDDLECLAYVYFYFLNGTLPWQGIRAKSKKEKYEKIMEKKMTTRIEDLCKGHPKEFGMFLKYVRNLEYDQKPDYNYLRKLITDAMEREHVEMDFKYDWLTLQRERTLSRTPVNNIITQ